ncbi:MAG: 50S ribosomal protein L18 [Candidatus Omnitrophica bacterium]|nr:50S ribosomal protein L18 [Candidatus Omnitrophota bacterium]
MLTAALREEKRKKRHSRVRKRVIGTPERPRVCVHRSHLNFYVQAVDDLGECTLFSCSTLQPSFHVKEKKQAGNIEATKKFGAFVAQELKKKKVTKIVFDRGGHAFHGRIKAFAEALRENGLEF